MSCTWLEVEWRWEEAEVTGDCHEGWLSSGGLEDDGVGHRDLVRSPRLVDGHLAHDRVIIGVLVSEHGVVGGGVND